MIKLKQAIIVEGKYDKIKLENFIDALIIVSNGFEIFKNKEKRQLLRSLAKNNGLIIMTDSDSAGMVIRSHLKSVINEGEVIQVYIPQIKGKEKRKEKASTEGFLGVEGISEEVIIDALKKAGINGEQVSLKKEKTITKALLLQLELSGTKNSKANREKLYEYLSLPKNMTTNALIDYVGRIYSQEEFKEVCNKCLNQKDKV